MNAQKYVKWLLRNIWNECLEIPFLYMKWMLRNIWNEYLEIYEMNA